MARTIRDGRGDRTDLGEALVTVSTGEGDQLTPDQALAYSMELIRAAVAIQEG